MKPIKDRILIERVKKDESKKGKLLLLGEPPENKFVVLEVGDAVRHVQKTHIVMTMPYGLTSVKSDDGRELFVCKEEDVLLIY